MTRASSVSPGAARTWCSPSFGLAGDGEGGRDEVLVFTPGDEGLRIVGRAEPEAARAWIEAKRRPLELLRAARGTFLGTSTSKVSLPEDMPSEDGSANSSVPAACSVAAAAAIGAII